MTAPALVTLTSRADVGSTASQQEIVACTRRLRPDLRIDAAFDSGRASLPRVVSSLASLGHREVVVVPLLVAPSELSEVDVLTAVDEATRQNPETLVRSSGPIGADAALLTILDERMRTAVRAARVRELDALVLAATGSAEARVVTSMHRLARLWSGRHHLPTSIAFAHASPPSTGEAVREWRRKGKRHVAVGSLFILPGSHARRAEELALEAGACAVSGVLGAHEELSRLIVARYLVGAVQLVPL